MAGIDLGGGHGAKRALNQELPLIPFIDFLLCLVAFLLVTAVWTQMARINVNAKVPGNHDDQIAIDPPKERELHVEARGEHKFQLVWKEGTTVVNTVDVERRRIPFGTDGDYRYPALAEKISEEWKSHGSHRAPTDNRFDRAVLHTDNTTPFSDIVAVIDAAYAPQRSLALGRSAETVPAFNVTFAVN